MVLVVLQRVRVDIKIGYTLRESMHAMISLISTMLTENLITRVELATYPAVAVLAQAALIIF